MTGKSNPLGEFEFLLLLCLLQAGGKSYGTEIRQKLKDSVSRDVSIGALYTTLDRLESKSLVRSELGSPTAKRGGRAVKFYEITSSGKQAASRQKNQLEIMWRGVEI